jgi:hypothetical protein
MHLYTFSDPSSTLKKINVRELLTIPVWRGNRYIDRVHAAQIQQDVATNPSSLDTTIFRVIKYREGATQQTFLIDGQHRQHVLREEFTKALSHQSPHQSPNPLEAFTFDVLVIEKEVEGESEAIEYFNTLNNVKPQFETDPKLLANKYIQALEAAFNPPRNPLIRPEGKTTRRPYLSSDRLRAVLEDPENVRYLKQSKEALATFVARVKEWNEEQLRDLSSSASPTTSPDTPPLHLHHTKQSILQRRS